MGGDMRLLLSGVFFLILFLAWARHIERSSIFFPSKEIADGPIPAGMPREDIYFRTSDNKLLNAWFITNDAPGDIVLFMHGNAGNISHREDKLRLLYDAGLSVFIFDYRGYGKSEGSPSEAGLYRDASDAFKYLTEERGYSRDDIVLYGESLGGAVAVELAAGEIPKALITEGAFTSVKDMARVHYPFIPGFILSAKFDALSKMKDVRCPKLIIHSTDDEIVPFIMAEKLYGEACEPKRLLKLRGGHNDAFIESEQTYSSAIKSFLTAPDSK